MSKQVVTNTKKSKHSAETIDYVLKLIEGFQAELKRMEAEYLRDPFNNMPILRTVRGMHAGMQFIHYFISDPEGCERFPISIDGVVRLTEKMLPTK